MKLLQYRFRFVSCLYALAVFLTTGCTTEGLLGDHQHNCSKNRYQELIGSYQGEVKAVLWETEAHEVQKNSCLWNVTFEIDGTYPNEKKRACDLRVFKLEAKLVEQINIDGGDYTCVEIVDESKQHIQYDDIDTWTNADADAPFEGAYGFYVNISNEVIENSTAIEAYHPYTEQIEKYITPVTGSYSTFKDSFHERYYTTYRIQKEIDGSLTFIDFASYSADNSYRVPEVSLSSAMLKQ